MTGLQEGHHGNVQKWGEQFPFQECWSQISNVRNGVEALGIVPRGGIPREAAWGPCLTNPARGTIPACSVESRALAGADGSKTNVEEVVIKGVLLGSGKSSDKYLEAAGSQEE